MRKPEEMRKEATEWTCGVSQKTPATSRDLDLVRSVLVRCTADLAERMDRAEQQNGERWATIVGALTTLCTNTAREQSEEVRGGCPDASPNGERLLPNVKSAPDGAAPRTTYSPITEACSTFRHTSCPRGTYDGKECECPCHADVTPAAPLCDGSGYRTTNYGVAVVRNHDCPGCSACRKDEPRTVRMGSVLCCGHTGPCGSGIGHHFKDATCVVCSELIPWTVSRWFADGKSYHNECWDKRDTTAPSPREFNVGQLVRYRDLPIAHVMDGPYYAILVKGEVRLRTVAASDLRHAEDKP